MTYYGQTLRELVTADGIQKIYSQTADTTIRMKDSTFFNDWMWGSTIKNNPYNDPFLTFFDPANAWITADDYFEGLSATYSKDKWSKQYEEWLSKGYVQNTVA